MAKKKKENGAENILLRIEELKILFSSKTNELTSIQRKSFQYDDNEQEKIKANAKIQALKNELSSIKDEIEVLTLLSQSEEFTREARKYIEIGKKLINSHKKEAIDIIQLTLDTLIDLKDGIEPQLNRFSKNDAQSLHRDFKNLREAGFDDDKAFRIVLAKIKPTGFGDVLSNMPSLPKKR